MTKVFLPVSILVWRERVKSEQAGKSRTLIGLEPLSFLGILLHMSLPADDAHLHVALCTVVAEQEHLQQDCAQIMWIGPPNMDWHYGNEKV